MSVSPKTRIPSLPSNQGLSTPASAEPENKVLPTAQKMDTNSDRGLAAPTKRKLEDRELSPHELERQEARPPPGEVNGRHVSSQPSSAVSESPTLPRKNRTHRSQPPVWAQDASILGKRLPNHPNFVLQKRVHSHTNGKSEAAPRTNRASRHPSPEATRPQHSSSGPLHPAAPPAEPTTQDILGPWEPSLTGLKPYEEMSKSVADFLFINVVNSPDMQEIKSRGIQFEIEAKLGILIDKDTNHRVDRFLDSECVLHDNGRLAFKSTMTDVGMMVCLSFARG